MSGLEIILDDIETMEAEAQAGGKTPSVGSLMDDPGAITREDWDNAGYYCGVIKATNAAGDEKEEGVPFIGYDDYLNARAYIAETGGTITGENFKTKAEYFPGLVTYESAVDLFETADDRILTLKRFPEFSKAAKVRVHSSVVLAADTGAGKSSLAINFLNDILEELPALYINLEMDNLTVLQRLISIRTGAELDRIEGYKNDDHTAQLVKTELRRMERLQPLQVLDDLYKLKDIEDAIAHATAGRKDPTVVIIDHSLLVQTGNTSTERYNRFTEISESLRRMSRQYNIVMVVLLQQNRTGKADAAERPTNSSLKESGSWENDATLICFLWWDPAAKCKRLIITKNRNGEIGEFMLNYHAKTQTYSENAQSAKLKPRTTTRAAKKTPREKTREKLQAAAEIALIRSDGEDFTYFDLAEAAGVSVSTVKRWIKEYGGAIVNGQKIDAAGIDDIIDFHGFRNLTPQESRENLNPDGSIKII